MSDDGARHFWTRCARGKLCPSHVVAILRCCLRQSAAAAAHSVLCARALPFSVGLSVTMAANLTATALPNGDAAHATAASFVVKAGIAQMLKVIRRGYPDTRTGHARATRGR